VRRLAVALALAAVLSHAPPAAAAGALQTGLADVFQGTDAPLAFKRTKAAGASVVRIYVGWRSIAPGGDAKPAGFDARNPADPNYNWSSADAEVRGAVAAGLRPLISVDAAPDWASGDGSDLPPGERRPATVRPNAQEFGMFMEALARRYSGTFQGLPRVRYWQAWNEPNHSRFLNPQFALGSNQNATPTSRMLSPALYRQLLTEFSAAVKRVHRDNLVVAGGLAPFFRPTPGGRAAAPLLFMRRLLCISGRNRPLRGCTPLRFDAWSHHPFTSGDPTHSALSPYDVSLGDLPEMRRVLRAAVRARHVVSSGRMRFWVTEFSWDTRPPDRYGVPVRLHARWTSEALYRMWRNGISLVTWYQLRDMPADARSRARGLVFQSGLYFRCSRGLACDRPKPALTAFRFPFVAFRSGRAVLVWGRTPSSRAGTAIVERKQGRRWRRVARVRANRHGIFTRRLQAAPRGSMRARLVGGRQRSRPFSLRRPPDLPVNPFGESPPNEHRGG
jgi:hypothetical protein